MASLSELPERERRVVLRLVYWSWFALFLGALGIILWLRHALPIGVLPIAFVLVLAFVAQEIWQAIYTRQVLRRLKEHGDP